MQSTKATVSNLSTETAKFVSRHWNEKVIGKAFPSWRQVHFTAEGRSDYASIPYHKDGGCYALAKGEEIVYIGSGIGKGIDLYFNQGLAKRVTAHVLRSVRNKYLELRSKWMKIGVTDIYFVGFESEMKYIALALEGCLISRLRPYENSKLK